MFVLSSELGISLKFDLSWFFILFFSFLMDFCFCQMYIYIVIKSYAWLWLNKKLYPKVRIFLKFFFRFICIFVLSIHLRSTTVNSSYQLFRFSCLSFPLCSDIISQQWFVANGSFPSAFSSVSSLSTVQSTFDILWSSVDIVILRLLVMGF